MPRPDQDIVDEVAAAVREAGARFDSRQIVDRLIAGGRSRSAAYRAVDRAVAAGESRRALTEFELSRRGAAEAEVRAAQSAVQVAVRATEAALTPAVVATPVGYTARELFSMLRTATEVTEKVLQQTRDEKGNIRLIKTALIAARQLRDSVVIYASLNRMIYDATGVQQFSADVMNILTDVSERHPEAARDIALRLQGIVDRWRT